MTFNRPFTKHGVGCTSVYLGEGDWTPCGCGLEAVRWNEGFLAYRDAIDAGRLPSEVRNPYANDEPEHDRTDSAS